MLVLSVTTLLAQQGTIKGQVYSATNHDPLEFATVRIQGTTQGATTDSLGRFTIPSVQPGFVRLVVSMLGYETTISSEVHVLGNQTSFIDIALNETSTSLAEVLIRPNRLLKRAESPHSTHNAK